MSAKLNKQVMRLRVLLAKVSHYLVLTEPPKRRGSPRPS